MPFAIEIDGKIVDGFYTAEAAIKAVIETPGSIFMRLEAGRYVPVPAARILLNGAAATD